MADYFECPDEMLPSVDVWLERIAGKTHGITLNGHRFTGATDGAGNIFLDCTRVTPTSENERRLSQLRQLRSTILESIGRVYGLSPYLKPALEADREDHPISSTLMQHANLPPKVFESAVVFAQQSQEGPNIEASMTLWQLALIRFVPDAVGEDWLTGVGMG